MSLLDQIEEKLEQLGCTLVRAIIVREGTMSHALVLARRLINSAHTVWRSSSEGDHFNGLFSGQYDMTLAEAEAEAQFELRASEVAPFDTTRQRRVDPKLEEACELLLGLPPVEWEAWLSRNTSDTVRKTCKQLERVAVQAARMASYLNSRADGATHLQALNGQNRIAERVRRAMGFTVPRDDLNF